MGQRPDVPVRQLRVSKELRELRKKAGMTCAEVAVALGASTTKISRMETGERGLYADDVSAILGLYRVPAQHREELLKLVRNGGDANWWQVSQSELGSVRHDMMSLEQEAITIANFEPLVIPGLLQTHEYATALSTGLEGASPDGITQIVTLRMKRQNLLTGRKAPRLEAIVDE